jgi:hypothetical protein
MLRRLKPFSNALLALTVAVLATPAAAQEEPNGYPVADMNLRAGPGTEYPVLVTVPTVTAGGGCYGSRWTRHPTAEWLASAHALSITERCALASIGPTLWRNFRHSDPSWTAPSIRSDMILGKDRS